MSAPYTHVENASSGSRVSSSDSVKKKHTCIFSRHKLSYRLTHTHSEGTLRIRCASNTTTCKISCLAFCYCGYQLRLESVFHLSVKEVRGVQRISISEFHTTIYEYW